MVPGEAAEVNAERVAQFALLAAIAWGVYTVYRFLDGMFGAGAEKISEWAAGEKDVQERYDLGWLSMLYANESRSGEPGWFAEMYNDWAAYYSPAEIGAAFWAPESLEPGALQMGPAWWYGAGTTLGWTF